jgi:hypothetical protein
MTARTGAQLCPSQQLASHTEWSSDGNKDGPLTVNQEFPESFAVLCGLSYEVEIFHASIAVTNCCYLKRDRESVLIYIISARRGSIV